MNYTKKAKADSKNTGKKKKKGLTIRFSELNNKSRKGTYIYIRDTKTGKFGIYKYNPKMFIDAYIDMFQINRKLAGQKKYSRINKQRFQKTMQQLLEQKTDKYTRQFIKKHREKTKKYIKMHKIFQPGMTSTADDLAKLRDNRKKLYTQLLEPLVLDKQLLGIVMKNADKFKQRLYYRITVYGAVKELQTEQILGTIEDHNKTIEQVATQYGQELKRGQIIAKYHLDSLEPKLRYIKATQGQAGKITRTRVGIEFRKG